jgi:hypothetical protein
VVTETHRAVADITSVVRSFGRSVIVAVAIVGEAPTSSEIWRLAFAVVERLPGRNDRNDKIAA